MPLLGAGSNRAGLVDFFLALVVEVLSVLGPHGYAVCQSLYSIGKEEHSPGYLQYRQQRDRYV